MADDSGAELSEGEENCEWQACGPPEEPEEFCALCLLRSADQEAGIPATILGVLRDMENTASRTPDTGIKIKCNQLFKMYNATIREHVPSKPEWTLSSIKNHLTLAHPTASVRRLQQAAYQPLGPLLRILHKHTFFKNRQGILRPNGKVIAAVTKLTSLISGLPTG
jgi:hypothetical protein